MRNVQISVGTRIQTPPPLVRRGFERSNETRLKEDSDGISAAVLTGCLSELSSCRRQDRAYMEGLRSYAEVYAAYQQYLMPDDPVLQHEEALQLSVTEEHVQLGLLREGDDTDAVSDDDIDNCGYLGWLRH